MPWSQNRKAMGMWMLLLRTTMTEKNRECWFIVNGVPIRYSLREHGLLCGLDCHICPPRHEKLGSLNFIMRNFGRREKIYVRDVKTKLETMRKCDDRLKMAVLLFLTTIVKGTKGKGSINSFLLRVVDDSDFCILFPWGRYTCDDFIKEVFHMMNYFNGEFNDTWCFPRFIIPLEILPVECIPKLKNKF